MTELTVDQERAALAGAGDRGAFREIFREYVRPVYWIANGILASSADAEEVAQETFIVAWRKLPKLDLLGESLLPWLATICRLQAANRLRVLRRERAQQADADEELLPSAVSVEDQVISTELAGAITTRIDTLGELDREVFILCAVEGYGYQAAAESLGITHASVRNRLSRARSQVRDAVKEVRDA